VTIAAMLKVSRATVYRVLPTTSYGQRPLSLRNFGRSSYRPQAVRSSFGNGQHLPTIATP
jgi:hypothetical protein